MAASTELYTPAYAMNVSAAISDLLVGACEAAERRPSRQITRRPLRQHAHGARVTADQGHEREVGMSGKPSYLGLLNAIANAETRAHCYLSAWAETTPSAEVRALLLKV